MRWPYNLEQTKTIVSTIQGVIAALAIIIGGGWTLYHFVSLHVKEIANENVQKAKLENEKLRIQNQREPIIEVRVKASFQPRIDRRGYLLNATATVSNKGNFGDVIDFTKPAFKIFKIRFDEKGIAKFSPPILDSGPSLPGKLKAANLMPGESQQFSLLHQVNDTGTYYIMFMLMQSERSKKQWQELVVEKDADNLMWFHGVFVTVGEQ